MFGFCNETWIVLYLWGIWPVDLQWKRSTAHFPVWKRGSWKIVYTAKHGSLALTKSVAKYWTTATVYHLFRVNPNNWLLTRWRVFNNVVAKSNDWIFETSKNIWFRFERIMCHFCTLGKTWPENGSTQAQELSSYVKDRSLYFTQEKNLRTFKVRVERIIFLF